MAKFDQVHLPDYQDLKTSLSAYSPRARSFKAYRTDDTIALVSSREFGVMVIIAGLAGSIFVQQVTWLMVIKVISFKPVLAR